MGEMHISWWETVKDLPPTHRFVVHEPETPRYARARQKLRYLVSTGEFLGWIRAPGDDEQSIEVAVWARPEQGRGPGYYGCFRLFIEDSVTTGAVLFCFYDGTESSPGLSTLEDAQAFADAHGFVREPHDGTRD